VIKLKHNKRQTSKVAINTRSRGKCDIENFSFRYSQIDEWMDNRSRSD
jgi:hypothetical protein